MTEGTPRQRAMRRARSLLQTAAASVRALLAPQFSRVVGDVAVSRPLGVAVAFSAGAVLAAATIMVLNAILYPAVQHALAPASAGEQPREVRPIADKNVSFLVDGSDVDTLIANPNDDREPKSEAIRDVSRYWVYRDVGSGLRQAAILIEARHEHAPGESRLVLDVAYFTEAKTWEALPWWEQGGLADSNQLAVVRRSEVLPFLFTLKYPATSSSLVTWLKGSWATISKQKNATFYGSSAGAIEGADPTTMQTPRLGLAPKLMSDVVGPELERILTQDLRHVQSKWPLVLLRIVNGSIQWITLAAFYAALLIVVARVRVFVAAERPDLIEERVPEDTGTPTAVEHWLRDELQRSRKEAEAFRAKWRVPSACHSVWMGALSAIGSAGDNRHVPTFVQSFADLEEQRREFRGFNLRFLLGAIPALGFIGTVLGIGLALMGTGSVLSDQLAKQQSGVSDVALKLGLAFDTTFVALSLTLVATFLTSWLSAAEDEVVSRTRRHCLNVLVYGSRPSGELDVAARLERGELATIEHGRRAAPETVREAAGEGGDMRRTGVRERAEPTVPQGSSVSFADEPDSYEKVTRAYYSLASLTFGLALRAAIVVVATLALLQWAPQLPEDLLGLF
jgi:biopolymer transport protein ExbB/TolQ